MVDNSVKVNKEVSKTQLKINLFLQMLAGVLLSLSWLMPWSMTRLEKADDIGHDYYKTCLFSFYDTQTSKFYLYIFMLNEGDCKDYINSKVHD
jgi:hypothetical protein